MTAQTLIAFALMAAGVVPLVGTVLLAAICRRRCRGAGRAEEPPRWPCRFTRTERRAARWILVSLAVSGVLISAAAVAALG